MKLGFSLKKAKKPVLHGAIASAGASSGGGAAAASSIANVFSSALPKRQEVEKVFVTDFDPNARQDVEFDQDGNAKKALVIPLIKANEWKKEADGSGGEEEKETAAWNGALQGDEEAGKSTHRVPAANSEDDERNLTVDELAAKKLLEDAANQGNGGAQSSSHASTLVIPMSGKQPVSNSTAAESSEHDEEDEKVKEIKAKLFNFEAQEKKKKKGSDGSEPVVPSAPILKQNVVPGMDELNDVNEKYRLDVSMRPDELDVHSSAYEMVPIEDFGAALLRGMGWKGSVDKDDKSAEPKPRHKLLGLGATIRPPLAGDAKNKHKKKHAHSQPKPGTQEKPRQSGLNHSDKSKEKKLRDSSRSPSPRRSKDGGSRRDHRGRRSSSRDRRSTRDDDRSRHRDDRNDSSASSRRRSRSRDRPRDRSSDRRSGKERESEKHRDRDPHRDERRKRSRSRDRSSDRKRSSRR